MGKFYVERIEGGGVCLSAPITSLEHTSFATRTATSCMLGLIQFLLDGYFAINANSLRRVLLNSKKLGTTLKLVFIPTFLFLLAINSRATEIGGDDTDIPKMPEGVHKELISRYPSLKQEAEVALGDLNGDGIADCAIIFHYTFNGIDQNRIAILYGAKDGQFTFGSESASWEPQMRQSEYISIVKKTVQVTASTATYENYAGTLYKFALRNGGYFLVGLEYSEGKIGKDDETYHASANFLTNQMEVKKIVGKRYKKTRHILMGSNKVELQKFSLSEAPYAGDLK